MSAISILSRNNAEREQHCLFMRLARKLTNGPFLLLAVWSRPPIWAGIMILWCLLCGQNHTTHCPPTWAWKVKEAVKLGLTWGLAEVYISLFGKTAGGQYVFSVFSAFSFLMMTVTWTLGVKCHPSSIHRRWPDPSAGFVPTREY